MERFTVNISDISPTDTPAVLAWQRVQKISIPTMGTVDLDNLGIKMLKGKKYKFGASDGMHRLAHIMDKRGFCEVEFSLAFLGSEDYIDTIVGQTKRDGVDSIETFLKMCRSGKFLRKDTA